MPCHKESLASFSLHAKVEKTFSLLLSRGLQNVKFGYFDQVGFIFQKYLKFQSFFKTFNFFKKISDF